MTRISFTKIGMLAVLAAASSTASAAIVNGSFGVGASALLDLWSITLDGALVNTGCAALNAADTQQCTFFGGQAGAGRKVVISHTPAFGPGSGVLDVQYDNVTGEITQVNSMRINYPNAVLVITGTAFGSGTVTITQGNGVPVPFAGNNDILFSESGTGTLGRILDPGTSLTALGNGTADADQGVAIGQTGIFQHADTTREDSPDFSVFTDVVDSCVPVGASPICFLIPGLRLDGVRYIIEGNILTGQNFTLKAQTSNNSLVTSSFSIVPVPAAVWLFGSALGLLGAARRRTLVS